MAQGTRSVTDTTTSRNCSKQQDHRQIIIYYFDISLVEDFFQSNNGWAAGRHGEQIWLMFGLVGIARLPTAQLPDNTNATIFPRIHCERDV